MTIQIRNLWTGSNKLKQVQIYLERVRNAWVGGSIPSAGTISPKGLLGFELNPPYDRNHPYAVDTVTVNSTNVYTASYDSDGNMIRRNGYGISWTVDNLPASLSSSTGSSSFSYDPDDARYYQSETYNGVTTDTTYIGSLFEVMATENRTYYRHNIIVNGKVIAVHTIDENGNVTTDYLHYDNLGSVDTITDDSGNVVQSMSFDAFGTRRDPSNWVDDLSPSQISDEKNYTDHGFTFQEELDNVSLIHMNGRV
jgi:hypothetical protein